MTVLKAICVTSAVLLMFVCSFAQTAAKKPTTVHPSATSSTDTEQQLSPAFKQNAWKALDAFDRLPFTLSSNDMNITNRQLLVDLDKVVDDAKYEVTTTLDKTVLHVLEMAELSKERQSHYPPTDSAWLTAGHRLSQCLVEARYYITPEQLSESGKAQAMQQTCNKKTDEWDTGITR